MEGSSLVLAYLTVGLALPLTLLLFVLVPTWAICDVATDYARRDTRVAWIIVVLVTWSFGGLVYGLFGTGSKPFRRLTWFTVLYPFAAFFVIFVVAFCQTGESSRPTLLELSKKANRQLRHSPARH